MRLPRHLAPRDGHNTQKVELFPLYSYYELFKYIVVNKLINMPSEVRSNGLFIKKVKLL